MNICNDLICAINKLGNVSLRYVDDFVSGWHHNRCGSPIEWVKDLQTANNKYWMCVKQPENCNEGMVEGWKAREDIKKA